MGEVPLYRIGTDRPASGHIGPPRESHSAQVPHVWGQAPHRSSWSDFTQVTSTLGQVSTFGPSGIRLGARTRRHAWEQSRLLRDCYFIAEQAAPAPHLAHPEGCAALRILLVTVPRASRSCEHFPDGFDLHLLPFTERLCPQRGRGSLGGAGLLEHRLQAVRLGLPTGVPRA